MDSAKKQPANEESNDSETANKNSFFNPNRESKKSQSTKLTSSSGRYGLKREYSSGCEKRNKKATKIAKSVDNTKPLSSYFGAQAEGGESSRSNDDSDNNINTNEHEGHAGGHDLMATLSQSDDNDFMISADETNNSNDDDECTGDVDKVIGEVEDVPKTFDLDFEKEYPTDRGVLPADVEDPKLKRAIIEHGPCRPKCLTHFVNDEGKTNFISSYYSYRDGNIEVPRQWLCYSPFLKKPYCEICWLFSERGSNCNRAWIDGVSGDTHNMNTKIQKHEKSEQHIAAARIYGRWKSGKTVDEETKRELKVNISFWTKVLQRVIAIILTLCSMNLALRGHRETVGEGVCTGGNFLGVVALVAQYDSVLADVISLPYRATKYLSHEIQTEIINLLGNAVRSSLVNKINNAPFWSIILDTTSDITRVDQLSIIVRWVDIREENFELTESFLGFVEVTAADAQGLVETTKEYLKGLGVDFKRIRGQGYDGANVMSGVRGGVQKLIKNICTSPVPFVHCASHNLNLVINDSVESITQNQNFFTAMQEIFNFFGNSLNRWRELSIQGETTSLTLKKLCTTRWTSRIDAVRAVRDRYVHILKVLTKISLTSDNSKERAIAVGLRKKMESYEFIVFIVFWERVLRAFNNTSRELQSPKMDLSAASRLLNITKNELQHLRDNYQSVLDTASAIALSWNITPSFTHSRRYFYSNQRYINDISEPNEFFKVNVFYRTLDVALTELRVRFEGQNVVSSFFSFLYPYNLKAAKVEDIESSVASILKSYHHDFTNDLVTEVRSFVREFKDEIADLHTVSDLLQLMYNNRMMSSFPQFQKLLVLFLTIPVTVASAERSFSKLKLIKTYLRSKMDQSKLTNLAILSIENDVARNLDKTEIIRKFASVNAVRQKNFR